MIVNIFVLAILVFSINALPFDDQGKSHHRAKRATPAADVEKRRWPGGIVYYTVDSDLGQAGIDFERAMTDIEKVSCVRYIERTNESDYVSIENAPQCKEPVGRQGGKQQILINATECGVYGFYLHASMQMLGFYHEHQRADRDKYVNIFEENIDPDWLDWSFRKLDDDTHFRNSSYDIHSIMHYGSYQYSINGKPTILAKDGTETISWTEKTKLSPLDVLAINDYYACAV